MSTTSISITPQFGNNTVTAIDCGTSTPRLSGTIDLSAFPNLQEFRCISNDITAVTGYENNSNITYFEVFDNKITGVLPQISAFPGITFYRFNKNLLTGTIPNLSANQALIDFRVNDNNLTGSIPSLSANSNLVQFFVQFCSLSGNIPNLSNNVKLSNFWVVSQQGPTKLTGFDGGSVSNTLGNFQAQTNQLNQSSIDAILSAFDASTRTAGTRNLFLQGGTNAAPSYTGGVTTVSAGNLFTTLGTVVTAQCTNHGHPNNSLVTITGLQTVFTGTFQISAINADQFRYTVSTNSPTLVTGTGTATMRRTTNATDGFKYYQNLALVSRYGTPSPILQGFPWSVNINFP